MNGSITSRAMRQWNKWYHLSASIANWNYIIRFCLIDSIGTDGRVENVIKEAIDLLSVERAIRLTDYFKNSAISSTKYPQREYAHRSTTSNRQPSSCNIHYCPGSWCRQKRTTWSQGHWKDFWMITSEFYFAKRSMENIQRLPRDGIVGFVAFDGFNTKSDKTDKPPYIKKEMKWVHIDSY